MINKQPAIYKLQNKRTGEIYVGGTRNAQGRHRQHDYDMRRGRHGNPKIQKAFIDGDRFDFIVLEYLPQEVTDDAIVRREQEWSNFLHPTLNSRNAIPLFGSDLHIARERKLSGKRTTPQSEEEKRKRAESVKRYWETHDRRRLTQEERDKISERVKGENHPRWGKETPEERKKRISDGVSQYIYIFVSPSGEEIQARSVKRFANERHLSETRMYDLANGHIKSNSGWTFKEKIYVGYKKER